MKSSHSASTLLALTVLCISSFTYADSKPKAEAVIYDGSQGVSGIKVSPDPEDDGNKVAYWEHAPKGFRLPVTRTEMDLSDYNAISLRFYSAVADGHEILITCDSNGDGEGNYYLGKFKVDWKGWKTVVIRFKDFDAKRKPEGWNKINQILMANSGYGAGEPNKNAVYYMDDFKAIKN